MNEEFIKQIDALTKSLEYATDKALYNISNEIYKKRIKDSKQKKTGKQYKIYRNGKLYKYHTASAKNQEGDASVSGKLNKDTNFKVSNGIAKIGVDKNNKYADFIQRTRQSIVRAGTPEVHSNLKTTVEKQLEIILNQYGYNK